MANLLQFQKHKYAARKLVTSRVKFYAEQYGFKPGKISIRNQRSRWGSCNTKGDLNFNYRLIELAPDLADYVIVHELCHTKEMNHSARFWSLVKQVVPNFNSCRKEIRKYERLHAKMSANEAGW